MRERVLRRTRGVERGTEVDGDGCGSNGAVVRRRFGTGGGVDKEEKLSGRGEDWGCWGNWANDENNNGSWGGAADCSAIGEDVDEVGKGTEWWRMGFGGRSCEVGRALSKRGGE